MDTTRRDKNSFSPVRRRWIGYILLAYIVLLVVSVTDDNLQVNVTQASTQEQHSLSETTQKKEPSEIVQANGSSSSTAVTSPTTTISTSKSMTEAAEPPSSAVPVIMSSRRNVTVVSSDFFNGLHLEPYCAMQSNAFKYLIWPDTPTDLSDWTFKRIRKCPTFVIPENNTFTKRVKYSLNCDNGKPILLPSFTNRSDDIDVVTLNDSCLARFTNSCCNDTRGTPNIVHYVWYFNKEMKFYMFLSMLSIVRYVRPCLILFHGEYLPYGKYWDYIIRIYPNVLHVKRPRPLSMRGKKIHHHEHSGDIMRLDALMQLGGIYFDADVIVLRDLEPLRKYNITLCYQASGFMLNSFIMAKKNATFLNLWMDGYRTDFRNGSYEWNSMFFNKDLARKRPELIHVEPGTLCCPQIMIGKPVDSEMVYDWTLLYGFHIYARQIGFPWDVNWIKNFNSTLGAMVRHVVYGNKELCV